MVQLNILSGKQAGVSWVARRFPVRLGRSAASDLQLNEPGVWDNHLLLQFKPAQGFTLSTEPGALTSLNGQPVSESILRNGDTIEIGSLKFQFWLAETVQAGFRFRETTVWLLIGAVCAAQIALVYCLARQ